MRQIGFSFLKQYKKEFGGTLLVGKKKTKRPLSTRHPIHLILKSNKAKLFHPQNCDMSRILKADAKRFGIQIYDLAVNWSHIHLLIKIPSREAYTKFIRSVTSKLMVYFTNKAGWQISKIFDHILRPYTRVLTWGKQFFTTLNYHKLNQFEARGFIRRNKNTIRRSSYGIEDS
jgi:REP element-mobilizing transposase RayT